MRLFIFMIPACLPAVLMAQAPNNLFEIYPPATTGTSRGSLSTSAGEVLQEVPSSHFLGVGDAGGSCFVTGMSMVTQDENPSTQEVFFHVVRARVAAGTGPDPSPGGVLLMAGPFSTPSSTQTTPTAFVVTTTFATPMAVPCGGDFFMGVALAAAPGWNNGTDGQSVWTATYYDLGPPYPNTGDNPRIGATNHAWHIVNGLAGQPTARVLNLGLNTTAAVLNIGNIDPLSLRAPAGTSFGAGGMYPDTKGSARDDGLIARVRDIGHDAGTAFLFVGLGVTPGVLLPPFIGSVYLGGSTLVLLGNRRLVIGETMLPISAPGSIPAAHGFFVYLQAATSAAAGATLHLSNLQGVSL